MANKIKLGATPPKTFKPATVKMEMPDGSEGEINITFKYRTQDEYWDYKEGFFNASAVTNTEGAEPKPLSKSAGEARERAAKHVLDAIDSWDLDIELNEANLCQLFNEVQQSTGAIIEAYQNACIQGRLGN